ncbi:MAG: hypothetical protein DWQ04_07230 [Chloroflexi bacterium]|nr:MAG: hypothetical protein DWQ04_07230 [Chloroflexota bacterium]
MFLVGSPLLLALLLLTGLISAMEGETAVSTPPTLDTFGYGFNVAAWDTSRLQSMGFNWMKVFNTPGEKQPVNVLLRLDANVTHLSDVDAFGDNIQSIAQNNGAYIEAYEIGNEPNLDASYGWTTSPNAADYVTLLCEAYGRIKAADPNAIVVSAGLAPTGRVIGDWNGHSGHEGGYQDEREFFKEFVAAGGGNCADVIGYHPYGYVVDFDTAPDPDPNCTNGFCFRGVEKLYELMQANGLGNKKVWATEFGWLVMPPGSCTSDGSWDDRLWQTVSEAEQATNLVGAFEYATTHWPWMEAMFAFNLNFNKAVYYEPCEQMRFYAVQDRPAESALSEMPKVAGAAIGELTISPTSITEIITPTQQPYAMTRTVTLENTGTKVFSYTVTAVSTNPLIPTIITPTGTLNPNEQSSFQVVIESDGRSVGSYNGAVSIETTISTETEPTTMPVTLFIFDEIYQTFVPLILHKQ